MFFQRPKPRPRVHAKSQRVGLDLTARRMRAVVAGPVDRPILLDGSDVDLRLVLALDRNPAGVGRVGTALVKRMPHLAAVNALGSLGTDRAWKIGRQACSAEAAVGMAIARAASLLNAEAESIAVALPAWMSASQVPHVVNAATVHLLPMVGTISAPLAVGLDRSQAILAGDSVVVHDAEGREGPSDIVPIRATSDGGPGSAVFLDADDHALTGSVVWIDRDSVRVLATATWPKLAMPSWIDRLIDSMADRCVRLCRRDPRDSADAEQSLFEQIDEALDRLHPSRSVSFHVRAAHWVQDLTVRPGDLDAACTALVGSAITGLTDLIYGSGVPAPPRAIWLTQAAARLPGLRARIHEHSAESTGVSALPADAVASAAAKLTDRWHDGTLPRQHVDTVASTTLAAPKALPERSRVGS